MSRFAGGLLLIPVGIVLGAGTDDVDSSPDKALVPDKTAVSNAARYYVPFPPTRDHGRDTHTLLLR